MECDSIWIVGVLVFWICCCSVMNLSKLKSSSSVTGLIAGRWGKNGSGVNIGRRGWRGFIGKLDNKRLKEGLRKSWWTGFGVLEFVWGIYVGVFELKNFVKNGLRRIIGNHAWWVSGDYGQRRRSQDGKGNTRGVTLEVGWVGNGTVEGSNLRAHRGLKRMLFWERKLMVCDFSTICSYVSSIFGWWSATGLCG